MKKSYTPPNFAKGFHENNMAAPLAIFSAATAAAAVVGVAAGAAATSKIIGDDITSCKMKALPSVDGSN